MKDLFDALGKYSPGVKWSGAYYVDQRTGVSVKNEVLVFMDNYNMGKPGKFLLTTQQKIDPKYYTIK